MDDTFESAIIEMQPLFETATRATATFIMSDDRRAEAAAVEGCVDRAVLGELDTTGHLAISRYTRFSPPGLGERLARKGRFDDADPAQRHMLARAARKTLAVGWLFACSPEAPMAARSQRDIWAFWSSSIRDELSKIVGAQVATMIHNAGRDTLITELKQARMTYALGGSKLHQIGYHLAQGGYYLRMCQTDDITQQGFDNFSHLGNPERWAWDAYSV